MKKINTCHAYTKRQLFIYSLILATVITACSNDSPPIKQPTIISNHAAGVVSIGSLRNGEVRAYEVDQSHCDTAELRLIDSQQLRVDGQFNLTLDIEQGLVLYRLQDATYIEEASGETVTMTRGQNLMAIASYDASQPHSITISPWSHLHTGLSCRLMKTMNDVQALKQATDFMVSLLGFDPLVTKGRLVTDPDNNRLDIAFDERMQLGFMNAALSQMSMRLSRQLEFVEHHVIHSVYMVQLFYQDIYHDGILDGRGANGVLHVPGEDQAHVINAASYRVSLPHYLLEFYDTNSRNQIAKGRGKLLSMALTINTNQHPQVFSNQPSPIDLDSTPPQVSWLSSKVLSGEVNISLRIDDFSGIDEVAFYAPGRSVNITATERDNIFMVHLDTRLEASGRTVYQVEVSDILGNSQIYNFPVDLINRPPAMNIISADYSHRSDYDLRARYIPISSHQRIDYAECILDEAPITAFVTSNELSCSVPLTTSGDNHITVRICDNYQLCSQQQHLVVYDSHPPQIDVVDEQPVYHGNISLIFEVFDNITGVQLPIEWQAHINQRPVPVQVQLLGENRYSIFIDTDFFGSNEVEITIRARDMLNNTKRYTGTYQVVNPLPTINIVSDPWFSSDSHTLAFRVTEDSSLNITTSCQGINNEILILTWSSYEDGIGQCYLTLPSSSEGTYPVNIKICGNYKLCTTHTTNITKDITGPIITLNNLPTRTKDNAIRVDISANDEHTPVPTLTYQLDEMMEQSVQNNRVLLDNLTTGNHRLIVRAWDTLGNPTEVIRQFLVLYDKPIITMTSPELTNNASYGLRVLIDPGTYQGDYERQCYLGDDKSVLASTGNRTLSCKLNIEDLAEGEHNIRIVLTADYGISYEHRVVITKDTQPPEIDLTNMAESYTSGVIPITIGIADRHSSVIRPTYRIDRGMPIPLNPQGDNWQLFLPVDQLATGRHSLTIEAHDILGNGIERVHSFLVLKDEPSLVPTSPVITRQDSYGLTARILKGTYRGSYDALCRLGHTIVTATVTDDRLSCQLDIESLADGNQTISVKLTANYGHSYVRPIRIIKDRQPPQVSWLNLADSYSNGTLPLYIAIRDQHAGVTEAFYSLNEQDEQRLTKQAGDEWSLLLAVEELPTGRHTIGIRALDRVNNKIEAKRSFLVLKDQPQLRLVSDGATSSDAWTLIATIDAGSYEGVYEAICQLGHQQIPAHIIVSNQEHLLSCALDLTRLDDGEHQINIQLTTDYGISYQRTISIIKDNQPPQLELSNIAAEFYAGTVPIRLGITDSYSSIATATYSLNGAIPVPLTQQAEGWSLILGIDQLSTGRHSLTIIATDQLGNEISQTRSFLVIKDEPSVIRTSKSYIKHQAYTLRAAINPFSYQGDYQGYCRLAGEQITAFIENNILSCPFNLVDVVDGNHSISIELRTDYQKTYHRRLSFIKDTQPPQVNWLNLADSYSNGTLPLYLAISDVHTGVREASYRLNQQTEKPLTKQAGDEWSLLLAIDELSTGRHTVTIHAEDRANNQVEMEQSLLILREQPQLHLTSHAATRSNVWTLIAAIDAGSYEGIYQGSCRLGHQRITAQIIVRDREHLLSCVLDFSGLDDGEHEVRVVLTTDYDISYERTVGVIKDTQPPQLDLTNIVAEFSTGAVPIEIGISDSHSSIATATYSLNDATPIPLTRQVQVWGLILGVDQLSTGRHSLTIIATDQLGNEISQIRSFLVLKDEPSITRTSAVHTKHQAYTLRANINPFSYQGNYQASCRLAGVRVTASIENHILSCPFDIVDLTDGNHSISIELRTDYQKTYHRRLSFIKDTQPPQVNWLNLADSYSNGTLPLYLAISDLYAGVREASYRLNQQTEKPLTKQAGDEWSLLLAIDELPTGRHTVTIHAEDRANNQVEMEQSLLILREQPQLHLTSHAATRSNVWTLIATIDAGSYEGIYQGSCRLGHQRITAQIIVRDREHLLSCVLDFSGLDDGEHEVRVVLTTDYDISYERTVGVIKDTQPPQLDLTNIVAEFSTGAVPIEIGISDSHSSIATATYSLNDATPTPLTRQAQVWGLILGVDQLSTGQHSLTIVATDQLGNEISQIRSFLVLKDEPSITRTSAVHTKHQAYTLRANINPFSYQGNYQASCRLAGVRVTASIENHILSCPFDIVDLTDGNHSISIELQTDYQKTYHRRLSFIKDTQPPQVNWLNLADSYSNGTLPLYLAISDVHTGVREASYRLNQQTEKPLTKQAGDEWSLLLAIDELPTGRHTVTIHAEDRANNQVEMEQSLLVLREQPQLQLTSHAATAGNIWTLVATIDAGSYEGIYQGSCRLGHQQITAQIIVRNREHLLSCVLDFSGLDDGEHEVRVILTTDYDISYERTVGVIKDTQPPQLDLSNIAAEFTTGAVPIEIGITDRHSSIATATYGLNDATPTPLTRQARGWGLILGVDQLSTGQHSLTIAATDQLGNEISQTRSFLVLKDEPSIIRTSDARTKHQAYTLKANINPFSYQGDYQASCRLAGERVAASIENNALSCPLNIVDLVDGNHTVNIELQTNYQKTYHHRLSFIKDTQPPTISAYNHQAVYTHSSFQWEFRVTDAHSSIDSVIYGVDSIWQSARYLGNNYWIVDLVFTEDGMHSLSLVAQDSLGQQRQQDFNVLVVTNPPQLDFTHPQLSRDTGMDITGNITLATPLAPIAYIHCLVDGSTPIRARIRGSTFVCHNYNIENYDENPIDVKVCDIHSNCAIFQTYVSQDNRLPQVESILPLEQLSYTQSCLSPHQYDNISLDCATQMRARSELWQLVDPGADGPSLSPIPFIIYQNTAKTLDAHLMDHDSLATAGIGYITIRTADISDPRFYFTRPQDLNISYSYTQLDCVSDSMSHCPTEHRHSYFVNRPLVPHSYHNGRAIITIPFTDEFLSHADRPLWYLVAADRIHRLDISVCDEARNCITKIARFRIKLFATQPQVRAGVRDGFIKLLRESQSYSQVFSLPVGAARYWEIINPSDYPIWVTVDNIADVTAYYLYLDIRKLNSYRKHKIREFTHSSYLPGDASCGRRPFPDRSRRGKYRIYRQYLSDNWMPSYNDPNGDRGGPYGRHGHQWRVRDSCSRAADRIVESRYEISRSYPRVVPVPRRDSSTYSFSHSLHYYYVNDRGELRDAYPQGEFYRIAAGGKLIVQSSELLQGTPFEPTNRQAIYGYWKKIDGERTITLPLSLTVAFAASRFNQQDIAQPDSRSLRYAEITIANQKFIRHLPIYCQGTCGSQRLEDTWRQLNP